MKLLSFFTKALIIASLSFAAMAGHHMKDKEDIVTIAAGNDNFSTLVTAIKAAGITDILNDSGPFTVFAPTNEAFNALPAGTLEKLLKPENKDALVQVLTYHVVEGKVTAEQVVGLSEATSVEGTTIDISTDMGSVMVEDASVVKTDIMASNGVIHVIDKVIIPDTLSASL